MNKIEKKILDLLKNLKDEHNVFSIKAEFEAEGTRMEELMRLKDIIDKVGLKLTVKIGGCEAIKDLYEAKIIGADFIVAPMIESEFGLRKFINAVKNNYDNDELQDVKFLINIETITSYKNIDDILGSNYLSYLNGIVIGRGDFAESLGFDRDYVDSDELYNYTKEILKKAKEKNLICGMGGGVSINSVEFLKKLPDGLLDFFETRKVIFKYNYNKDEDTKLKNGIYKALNFELLWLKNKSNLYHKLSKEDENRIKKLQNRLKYLVYLLKGKI